MHKPVYPRAPVGQDVKIDFISSSTGYNDVPFPQSQIAMGKLPLYPERFTERIGVIDSMESNRNKEDIVVSRIVITRVVCSMNGNSLIGDFDLAGTGQEERKRGE